MNQGQSSSETTRSRPWRAMLLGAYAVALALSVWGYYYRLDQYPPYMDYDSATIGIFVNNLTFHGDVDYFFDQPMMSEDHYRMWWAAQFLPAAVVLSSLQRILHIAPDRVGELLAAATMVFGLLGCGLAAAIARRRAGFGLVEALFIVAFCATLPPFLLYLRTEVPHFLYSFCMLWLAVYLIVRFLESMAARWLFGLAAAGALYALLPYQPIVWLPIVGLWLTLQRGLVASVLRSRSTTITVAAVAGLALFATVQYTVATHYDDSYPQWRAKVSRFMDVRAKFALSRDNASLAGLADKAAQLAHQHFFFRHDELGDETREDDLWTLPQPHVVWLLLLPLGLLGLWRGLRDRDPTAHVFASVMAAGYLLAFTVSTAEGRYLLGVVPCYAYFVCAGVHHLVTSRAARTGVLGAVLLASSANTFVLVRGQYETHMKKTWEEMAGMRETLALIRDRYGDHSRDDAVVYLAWPRDSYESWLYLEMLGNMQVAVFKPADLGAEFASGERLFSVVEFGKQRALDGWRSYGFEVFGQVVDDATGRQFYVLTKLNPSLPGMLRRDSPAES
ncbi:MAG: hypothetical protein HY899_06025 [Deltaproteobacteria bacterium]|nr:hypothetical protein [Deltaproteobacteria bacterium]